MKRTLVPFVVLGTVAGLAVPIGMSATAVAAVAGPVNLAPDDASTYQKNVVLSWDEISGATSYEVQITSDGFGTDAEVFSDTAVSNRYVPPVALPRSDYVWRVRATFPGSVSDWSSTADLVRGWDPTVAPVITHLGGNSYDWSVSWTPVTDASFYEVQVSTRDTEPENVSPPPYEQSGSDVITCFTMHTTFTGSELAKGGEPAIADGATCEGTLDPAEDYSIRVRARDGSVDSRTTDFPAPSNSCTGVWQAAVGSGWTGIVPECSGWSDTVSGLLLNPSTSEPAKVTGLGTVDVTGTCDSADACTDTPVMSWDQDPDAAFYRVYLSRDRSGTDYDRLYDNVVGTHFQMYTGLADRALPWYWRVQACNLIDPNDDGSVAVKCGPASDVSSFAVSNKGLKSAGASPAAGDPTVRDPFVDFSVPNEIAQADHQAKAFRIQVAKDAAFSSVVHTATVDQRAGDATHTTYRWDGAPDGTFYWRYRAVDQTGATSPWTQAASLTVTVNASIPKVSIKSASGWGLADSILLESDKPLSGVTSNTLGVTLKDGARLTGKIVEQTSTSWKFTPDTRWVAGASYVPYVGATVTAGNGKVAVGDDVARRPSGLVDSKTASMKKVDGDFPWKTLAASDAIGKSYVAAKHKASSSKVPLVSVRFGGTKVALHACKSSANGIADIYLDGVKVRSVDLYRAASRCGEVWSKSGLTDGVHTLEVKVSGKKSSDSSGTFVGVDAVKAG